MLAADEPAQRHSERSGERRQIALVHGFAGLEAVDRASENVCGHCQVVDAVAACDAKAKDACRQRFYGRAPVMSVAALRAGRWGMLLVHHRFALAHQKEASIA